MRDPLAITARRLGLSERSLWRYLKEGCPGTVISKDEAYLSADEVSAWMRSRGLTGRPGPPSLEAPGPRIDGVPGPGQVSVGDVREDLLRARLDKERDLVDKHRHFLEVAKGEVVSRDQVRRERLARIAAVKAKLLALPDKLAGRLAHRPPEEVHRELRREMLEVLSEFAGAQGQGDARATG